jgi:dipeptidyl aminopeptidase/acylaminoacyl peptidase
VTLEDLKTIGADDVTLELSPDGRNLVYGDSFGVWLIATEQNEHPRRIGSGFLPTWSPSGDKVAYYSVTKEGIQLKVTSLKLREERQVTHVIGGINPDPSSSIRGPTSEAFRYGWAPDGTKIVFASRVPLNGASRAADASDETRFAEHRHSGEPLILTNTTPPEWTLVGLFPRLEGAIGLGRSLDGHSVSADVNPTSYSNWRSQLFIVNIETEESIQITGSDTAYFAPAWSPGRTIVCAGSERSGLVFGATELNIYKVDPFLRTTSALTHGPGVRWFPSWSSNGLDIAYLGSESFFSQPSVFIGSVSKPNFVNATDTLQRYVDKYRWDVHRAIVVTYKDGVSEPMKRISLEVTGSPDRLGPGDRQLVAVGDISVNAAGAIAWAQRDPTQGETIRYLPSGGSSSLEVVTLTPQVKQWALGKVEVIRWKNHRGDDMEGAILLPPNYRNGRRYPVIVDSYPLNNATEWLKPMKGNQAWAALGYVVFRPNPRAPHAWVNPWKTEAASLEGKGPGGWEVAVDDVLSGVDGLIARGIADPDRMCLYGFSNGAGVVNYLVTRTRRFKCAVSVAAALSDWVRPSLLNTSEAHYLSSWAGASLWERPEAYIELSAVFHLKSVTTPMLLAAGDNDGNFLLDTIEMYNGLREIGANVTLLRYSNQGHGFTGASLQDFWTRELNFFALHLGASN